jgi:hypothetical protein
VRGVFVQGLSERTLHSVDELMELLDAGLKRRRVAPTNKNVVSSRSHAVLTMRAFGGPGGSSGSMILVDLAGSERSDTVALGPADAVVEAGGSGGGGSGSGSGGGGSGGGSGLPPASPSSTPAVSRANSFTAGGAGFPTAIGRTNSASGGLGSGPMYVELGR